MPNICSTCLLRFKNPIFGCLRVRMQRKNHFWVPDLSLSCNDLRRIHFLVSLELLLVPVWKNRNGTIFSCFERKVVCTTKIPFNKVHFTEKKISNLWKKILMCVYTLLEYFFVKFFSKC